MPPLRTFRSADQIAEGALSILGDPEFQIRLEARAYAYGRQAAWPVVGARVGALMRTLADRQPRNAWGSVKCQHSTATRLSARRRIRV